MLYNIVDSTGREAGKGDEQVMLVMSGHKMNYKNCTFLAARD